MQQRYLTTYECSLLFHRYPVCKHPTHMTSLSCFLGSFLPEYPTTKPGIFLSLISFLSQGRPFWEHLSFSREPSHGEGRGFVKYISGFTSWNLILFLFSFTMPTVLCLIFSLTIFKGCIVFYCTICHNLLDQNPTDKYISCFQNFATMNNAAKNILTHILYYRGLSTSVA